MAQTASSAANKIKKVVSQKFDSFEGSDLSRLDQFVSFMKENWRPLLSELVAAGVTAYLSHNARDKKVQN